MLQGYISSNKAGSWHIDPEEVTMAEVNIEPCDGLPCYVEARLDDRIATVGHYCPWSAELNALEDYR